MANNTNVMSIAPNPSTPRRISTNTQPKYKTAARADKRTFGSTLDKVHAKLDELKQSVQDLQDANKKIAQVEDEPKLPPDETTETQAQGTSDNPQDAEKAISNEELGIKNNSEVAEEDVKPADIFFVTDKNVAAEVTLAPEVAPEILPIQKLSPNADIQPVEIQAKTPAEEVLSLDTSADLVDEQSPANFLAASSMAYLFGTNKETLLATKPVAPVETPKADAVQNLMSLMPQENKGNAQSMLNLLSGKAWRPVDVQPQAVDVQPLQVQPTIQPQAVDVQPAQIQLMIQPQAVDVQLVQVQPTIQPQAVDVQPAQVQPMIQPQTGDIQPLQVQPTIQPQAGDIQPLQVQPTIQPQAGDIQPLQVQSTIQPQAVDVQPAQVQPTIQPQAVDVQPAQVQPTIQPQAVDVQPTQVQPTIQPQAVDVQPTQVQPTIQPQAVDVQPLQVQPTIQPQAVDVQPLQIQPTIQPQVVDVQLAQIQPTIQLQVVDVQPAQIQPTIQPQAVDVQPLQIQPTIQPQVVDVQPAQIQPTIQPQAADVQPAQVQPTIQPQTVDVQPAQVQSPVQLQPIIAPQRVDERPAPQIFSELLGVNVQVEDAPTAAPVTPTQSPPQQFNQQQQQPQQQDAQNFQNQIFQATTEAPQAQPVATGGEVFTVPLTASDATQPQPTPPAQAPDAPPPMPQEDFDVPAQIVRQARLIRTTENTEMVIKLNPEHLGELTLRVSVSQNGAVNASFHSDNAQVRTIIENSLVQLRQELNDAGLKIEHVDVYAGLSDGGLMSGQGGQAWQQGRQQRQGNRQIDLNSLERDVDSTAPVNQSTTEGVDYSV